MGTKRDGSRNMGKKEEGRKKERWDNPKC